MPWKRLLIGIALAAIIAAATWYFFRLEPPPIVQLPGVVEIQEVRLGSKIGGRVAQVLVHEGETVEAGQLLVSFEVPEREAQLVQQQARLAAAEADLEKAKKGPAKRKSVRPGTIWKARPPTSSWRSRISIAPNASRLTRYRGPNST